jgi:hypothetical protein
MATPEPTEVAPWYLRNINQALELDNVTGQVHVRSSIVGGNVTIAGNIIVSNITVDAMGNIDLSGNTMPVSGNVTVDTITGNVNVTQGTDPWIVSGNVNIDSLPEVEIKNDIDNPIPISKDTSVNSITNPIYVSGVNNASFFAPTQSDAFGRLRVSNPQTLFDTQARYYDHQQFASNTVGGGNVVYNANSSTFAMNVGTGSTDSVFRETYKVFPYQPGKSLLILSTFCMNAPKANLRQRAGYFSANNGIYFEIDGTTLNMVIRSSSSGVIVEDRVPQINWNGDTLLGTGGSTNLSGIQLNPAVDQIWFTDIEWLGVGSVRVGFVIDGQYIVCHTFPHANVLGNTTTYMTTASLPLRYEITNTGTTASNSTLRQICSSVISEGGYQLSGTPRSIGHALNAPVTLPNDQSFKPILSIRLKSTMLDAIVLPTYFTIAPTAQSTFKYRIYSRAITTGGSWVGVDGAFESPVEYNLNPTTISSGAIVTEGFIISSNQASAAPSQVAFGFEVQLQRNSFTSVAYEYVIAVATTGTNQTVYSSIEWQEVN